VSVKPGTPFGKYTFIAVLGRGGGGVVYHARQEDLGRDVALKLLTGPEDDPRDVPRFLREARAAAKLQHPNIVAIHEVGEVDGKHYFTMDLVEGESLDVRVGRGPLPAKEACAIVRDAARAVHYAHEQGIVHRDLKPGNILLAKDGRPVVTDFGLARQVTEKPLTQSGDVLGTPAYMPPEQARGAGRAADRRSDLYALGAVLYHLLTGRAPFAGPPLEVLLAVLDRDPPAPRSIAPSVHPDAETIVLKAMEKDPARRYATAAELADDLGRFLDGEIISARPPSLTYRLGRAVARRKGLVAAGLLVAAVSGAALFAVRGKEAALTSAQRQLVEQMRRTSDACLDAALELRRGGRVEGMQKYAAQTEEVCRAVIAGVPSLAEPHHRLGRIYRAQMRDGDALLAQEEALKKDASYAPALYERVVLNAKLHAARLDELVLEAARAEGERLARLGGGSVRAGARAIVPRRSSLAPTDPMAQGFIQRMEEDLSRLRAAPPSPEALECAEGLVEWARGNLDDASRRLEAIVARAGHLEEAWEALAYIAGRRGRYEEVVRLCDRAIALDRGYAPYYLLRGNHRAASALAGGLRDAFDAAVADYDEALRLAPDYDLARLRRGATNVNRAILIHDRGDDSRPALERGMADIDEVLRRRPGHVEALRWRGHARLAESAALEARGLDGRPALERALADYGEAARLGPSAAMSWIRLGEGRSHLGILLARRGADPSEALDAAVAAFDEALKRDPTAAEAWGGRASARINRGLFEAGRGADPVPQYRAAVEDATQAMAHERAPRYFNERGSAYLNWGNAAQAAGEDPSAVYERAIADLTLAVQGGAAGSLEARGLARLNWATWRYRRQEEPEELPAALGDFEEAARQAPESAEPRKRLGAARMLAALVDAWRGRDPVPAYQAAVRELEAAVARRGSDAESWETLGLARMNWGGHARSEELLKAALEAFTRAIALNGADASAWWHRASTRLRLAELVADPAPVYEAAAEDAERSTRLNAASDEGWLMLARACEDWAQSRQRAGQDPVALHQRAVAAIDEAAKRRATAESAYLRGQVHVAWARWAARAGDPAPLVRAALADYDEALRRDPRIGRAHLGRANAYRLWGETSGSPEEALRRYEDAVEAAGRAVELDPRDAGAWALRGASKAEAAAVVGRRGTDPTPRLEEAESDLSEALKLNPAHAMAREKRSFARGDLALAAERTGRDGRSWYEGALADLEEAIGRQPRSAALFLARANLRFGWGQARDDLDAFAAAEADYGEVVLREPRHAEAWGRRGLAKLNLATRTHNQGGDATTLLLAAIGFLDRSIEVEPKLANAWQTRGNARYVLGAARLRAGASPEKEFRDALADYEKAEALDPAFRNASKEEKETIRRHLEK
jgi:tetratricopeptide (TPR) repeat protein